MMKLTKQKGFTLIELMIVIAIIGILAAVALPMYQDYIFRAKAVEAITLLGASKVVVDENYHMTGTFLENATAFGIKIRGKYVTNIVISNANKTIIATMDLGNLGLYYNTANETWTCFNSDNHGMTGGIVSKYIPIDCRQ